MALWLEQCSTYGREDGGPDMKAIAQLFLKIAAFCFTAVIVITILEKTALVCEYLPHQTVCHVEFY